MLRSFEKEWSNALASRKSVYVERDDTGTVTKEDSTFVLNIPKFGIVNMEMDMSMQLNTAKKDKIEYHTEVFVPATKKFMPSLTFKSKTAAFIAIIRSCIVGNRYEKKIEAKLRKARESVIKSLVDKRKNILDTCLFTEPEKKFFLDHARRNIENGRFQWDDYWFEKLPILQFAITGRDPKLTEVQDDDISNKFAMSMFESCANLLSKTSTNYHGNDTIHPMKISMYCDNKKKRNYSEHISMMFDAMKSIKAESDTNAKFTYFIKFICKFYEWRFGTNREKVYAMFVAREAKNKARLLNAGLGLSTGKNKFNLVETVTKEYKEPVVEKKSIPDEEIVNDDKDVIVNESESNVEEDVKPNGFAIQGDALNALNSLQVS